MAGAPAVITIGSSPGARREDAFADAALTIRSPRGLAAQERALIAQLPRMRAGRALVIDSAEGVAAMALRALNPGMDVAAHFFDAWDHAAAKRAGEANPGHAPELSLRADPPEGPFDFVALPLMQRGIADFVREQIRGAAARLKPGGLLIASTDNHADRFLRDEIKRTFGACSVHPEPQRRGGVAYTAKRGKQEIPAPPRTETAFTLREGERVLTLVSRAGVFSHGKLDGGTRALLRAMEIGEATRILDLGCGCGVVGVVAGTRSPGAQITCVDSHARAVEAAQRNLEAHGLAERSRVILSADPVRDLAGPFDLVLTNPPYYGNRRIGEMFVEAAARHLAPGGRLTLVTKGPAWYEERFAGAFQGLAAQEIGGYSVLTATRLTGRA